MIYISVFGDHKSIVKHTEPAQNSSEIMWVSYN